jgi:methylmalonyl-CoA mutase
MLCLNFISRGGHNRYFKYMYDLLKKRKRWQVISRFWRRRIILPSEIAELQEYGITRVIRQMMVVLWDCRE